MSDQDFTLEFTLAFIIFSSMSPYPIEILVHSDSERAGKFHSMGVKFHQYKIPLGGMTMILAVKKE